ncbi:hypothetical protein V6N11_061063 [Hibiscus sabdariffa]|uniref:Cytochrome P450 n=1 Tax=Hibiscus sabdariffa TaxID=183260 RepID=A0ABR2QSH0_9ROSI
MLPETGSKRTLLHTGGAWISSRNDQPRQIKECTKKQQIQAERSCTDAALDQRPRIHPGRRMNTCRRHLPRLVFIKGEKWVKQRNLSNYALHGESFQNMTPAVIASVETMLEKWRDREGEEIEVFGEFRLLTSKVILRTTFDSSYLEGEEIFDMLNKLSVIVGRNIFDTGIPFIKYVLGC